MSGIPELTDSKLRAPLVDGSGFIDSFNIFYMPEKGRVKTNIDPSRSGFDIPFGDMVVDLGHRRIAPVGVNKAFLKEGIVEALVNMHTDALNSIDGYGVSVLTFDVINEIGEIPEQKILTVADPVFLNPCCFNIGTKTYGYDKDSRTRYTKKGINPSTRNYLDNLAKFSKDNEFLIGIGFTVIDTEKAFALGLNPHPNQEYIMELRPAHLDPVIGRFEFELFGGLQIATDYKELEKDIYTAIRGGN